MQKKFKKYASTNARLLSHLGRLVEIRGTKRIRPITIEISPTDKCNLNCSWCSVRDRPGDELTLTEVRDVIHTYVSHGAKSIEFTGGGDPLMHPDIEEMIDYAYKKTRAVGLITNGIALPEIENLGEFTKKLMWMRISLSGIDFGPAQKYYEIWPEDIKTFMGVSYLADNKTKSFHDLQLDMKRVNSIAQFLKVKYVRIIPNCNDKDSILWLKRYGEALIKGFDNFFVQAKDFRVPPTCYWRYIKPFVNSDGWVYQCSTCSLFERKFPEPWRVGRIEDIQAIYRGRTTSFNTSNCDLCFFTHQNQVLEDLLTDVVHKEFV